ncbi:MAG: ABC transporter permease subunit, partial [Candidatus Marinimicrobia bacterium]|nr:ABC transporter permease subunit [Candidatus Neomarinimicrobiota bacterium]
VCLSDVLSFSLRQIMKPVIEILAAIPSVAYGFFALVIFAPLLQDSGGNLLAISSWIVCTPLILLLTIIGSGLLASKISPVNSLYIRIIAALIIGIPLFTGLWFLSSYISGIQISSGTNALNVSIILGIMALPTVVSVSDDSLTAVDRSLREGSYALGATRAETLIKVVIPAAKGGIVAAVILGIMRAIGETMVVWMASGNAAKIPRPWFNFLEPIRTLTATIAGDMGEADQVTGSSRYHVLFALALCLLLFTFICNLIGEKFIKRSKKITR